jgi:RimJ/RimL family protein N-acetyltransferase
VTSTTIRILTPRDAREYLVHRRRALAAEPQAFVTSPEDDLADTPRRMRRYLHREPVNVVLGAFAGRLVGSVGIHRDRLCKSSHRARLWGLFVEPALRRGGIGGALLAAAVEHARALGGVVRVHLAVSAAATPARALFERRGFRRWGVERDAFREDGASHDLWHMALELDDRRAEAPA